uniref:Putative group i salivary lipocalin n=1 Tax=Rhipicephalus pulchellus TaxID=72859 RepID=L7LTA2_RHIPC
MRAGALVLVFGLFADVYGANLDDLIAALDTNQTIWLYNKSYQNNQDDLHPTCVRWHRKTISKTLYTFDNDFKNDGEYYTDYNTNATLSDKTNSAEMNITYIREGHETTSVLYKLDMWNETDKCFILTLGNNNGGKVKCELHLWHEKWNKDHPSCEARFQKICEGQKVEVFSQHACM